MKREILAKKDYLEFRGILDQLAQKEIPELLDPKDLQPYLAILVLKVIRGNMGPMGLSGPMGIQGRIGLNGDVGPRGSTGYKGRIGQKGERGDIGNQGRHGRRGAKGESGADAPCPLGSDGLPLHGCGWNKHVYNPKYF